MVSIMSLQEFEPRRRRRFSLSVRVSIGLVLAAIIPLGITLLFSEMQTRPALTNQANTAMESDAKTRVQLIDTYIRERTLDALTLSQVQSVAILWLPHLSSSLPFIRTLPLTPCSRWAPVRSAIRTIPRGSFSIHRDSPCCSTRFLTHPSHMGSFSSRRTTSRRLAQAKQ